MGVTRIAVGWPSALISVSATHCPSLPDGQASPSSPFFTSHPLSSFPLHTPVRSTSPRRLLQCSRGMSSTCQRSLSHTRRQQGFQSMSHPTWHCCDELTMPSRWCFAIGLWWRPIVPQASPRLGSGVASIERFNASEPRLRNLVKALSFRLSPLSGDAHTAFMSMKHQSHNAWSKDESEYAIALLGCLRPVVQRPMQTWDNDGKPEACLALLGRRASSRDHRLMG